MGGVLADWGLALIFDLAGGAALGLVAGWWCAPLVGTSTPWRTASTASGGLTVIAAEIVLLEGPIAALMFLAGCIVGFGVHAGFRSWIAGNVSQTISE